MTIEEERDEIIKHVDNLVRIAQAYKAQNAEHVHRIGELTTRAEFADAVVGKLAVRAECEFYEPREEHPGEYRKFSTGTGGYRLVYLQADKKVELDS